MAPWLWPAAWRCRRSQDTILRRAACARSRG